MSGLRWVRLDAAMPFNHKVMDLMHRGRHRAIAAYCLGLAYSGGQGTDGWIPASALHLLGARPVDARHLVDAGLWVARPGGWDIHDWLDYQPSAQDNADRTARARAAALTRWNGAAIHSLDHATRNARRMPDA